MSKGIRLDTLIVFVFLKSCCPLHFLQLVPFLYQKTWDLDDEDDDDGDDVFTKRGDDV